MTEIREECAGMGRRGALACGPARDLARMSAAPGLPSADGGGTGRPRRVDLPQGRWPGEWRRAAARTARV